MDPFIDVFCKIDKNYDGVITRSELQDYTRVNRLDPQMIERWEKLFTEERTHQITLNRFLEVLGIAKEEFEQQRRITIQQQSGYFKLGKDVEYIAGDMSLPEQINVSNEARSLIEEYGKKDNVLDIAAKLKKFLDSLFGPSWHVMIGLSSYSCAYEYEAETAFQFKLKQYLISVWKTPENYMFKYN
uniref:EF-hand domain-containing protein n=1 Tax=Trichobilharzia regenti TaxID=157069 RepID=A0AA85JWJ1_TRIRE|nr:unnamed protein product [Trichobilharzia regenti]